MSPIAGMGGGETQPRKFAMNDECTHGDQPVPVEDPVMVEVHRPNGGLEPMA